MSLAPGASAELLALPLPSLVQPKWWGLVQQPNRLCPAQQHDAGDVPLFPSYDAHVELFVRNAGVDVAACGLYLTHSTRGRYLDNEGYTRINATENPLMYNWTIVDLSERPAL